MRYANSSIESLQVSVEADLAKYQTGLYQKKKMTRRQKEYIFSQTVFAAKMLIQFGENIRQGDNYLTFPDVDEEGQPVIFGSVRHVMGIQEALVASGQQLKSYLWCAGLEEIAEKIESYFGISFNGLKIHRIVRHKTTKRLEFLLTELGDFSRQRNSVTLGSYEKRHNFITFEQFEKDYEFVK